MTDMGDPYMYPEEYPEGYDPYLQDADILDRPDLFYDGRHCLILVVLFIIKKISYEL